jgi:hypothetical protein
MKYQIIGVRFHEFQIIKQQDNITLARCSCCKQPRYAVFKITNLHRIFYYHGFDQKYAEKIFSSLISRINLQSQVQ